MILSLCSLRALLIQIGVKLLNSKIEFVILFESFVNSDRCKAKSFHNRLNLQFESFVNSDRCKALLSFFSLMRMFESFVNSDRCKAKRLNLSKNR